MDFHKVGTFLNFIYSFLDYHHLNFIVLYVQTSGITGSSWSFPILSTLCVENAPFTSLFVQSADDIFDWTLDANGIHSTGCR